MERMGLFGVVKQRFLCISVSRCFQIFQCLSLSLNITWLSKKIPISLALFK